MRIEPAAKPVYEKLFSLLEEGASFQETANWLNEKGIPPSPYCRLKVWNGVMVGRIVKNPIVKGLRTWNKSISVRENESGEYKSVKAPEDHLLTKFCPHLVVIEPERFDRVQAILDRRTANHGKKLDIHRDCSGESYTGMSSTWPGRHLPCGFCGRAMLWYNGGNAEQLGCVGTTHYLCWNDYGCSGRTAARNIIDAVLAIVEALPGYDDALLADVRAEMDASRGVREEALSRLADERADNDRCIETVVDSIQEMRHSAALAAVHPLAGEGRRGGTDPRSAESEEYRPVRFGCRRSVRRSDGGRRLPPHGYRGRGGTPMRYPPADEHHPRTASVPYFPFDENEFRGGDSERTSYLSRCLSNPTVRMLSWRRYRLPPPPVSGRGAPPADSRRLLQPFRRRKRVVAHAPRNRP